MLFCSTQLFEDFLTVKSHNSEDFHVHHNGNKKAGGYDEKC